MTIRTVTLSPGVDHVVRVNQLEPGGVGAVLSWIPLAGGKGVNVARAVHAFGLPCVAYSLVGESDQQEFTGLINEAGPRAVTVAVPGATRRNLTLSVDGSSSPASHAAGPRLTTARDTDAERLLEMLLEEVEPGDVVSFNGAVPQPVRASIWAEAAVEAHSRGATVIADAQGDALVALVSTRVVTMAKPNEAEARDLISDGTAKQIVEQVPDQMARSGELLATVAVREMLAHGVVDPVVSLGAHGVVHQRDGVMTHSWCDVPRPQVHVGAGDAFVAGYCVGLVEPRWQDASPADVGIAVASAHVAGASGEDHVEVAMRLIGTIRHRSLPNLEPGDDS